MGPHSRGIDPERSALQTQLPSWQLLALAGAASHRRQSHSLWVTAAAARQRSCALHRWRTRLRLSALRAGRAVVWEGRGLDGSCTCSGSPVSFQMGGWKRCPPPSERFASCFLDAQHGNWEVGCEQRSAALLRMTGETAGENRACPRPGLVQTATGALWEKLAARSLAPAEPRPRVQRAYSVAWRAVLTGSPSRSNSCWRINRSRQIRKRIVAILHTPQQATLTAVPLPYSWVRFRRIFRG